MGPEDWDVVSKRSSGRRWSWRTRYKPGRLGLFKAMIQRLSPKHCEIPSGGGNQGVVGLNGNYHLH